MTEKQPVKRSRWRRWIRRQELNVGVMLLILAAVTLVGILAARPLVTLYAFGFQSDPQKFETTVDFTRLVFPYIFFNASFASFKSG